MEISLKKQAILAATLQLITEHGFHGTPMSLVAKEAKVAAGTIYHYFDSKEALINELYAHLKQRMGEALMRYDDAQRPIRERFYQFYESLFFFFVEHRREFFFLEQYANSPYITQASREANEHHYRPAIEFLEQGIALGVLRPMDIQLMSALVYGSIATVVKLHLTGALHVGPNLLHQAAQSCWDGVRIN